jgi:hypothetical protein
VGQRILEPSHLISLGTTQITTAPGIKARARQLSLQYLVLGKL